MRNLPVKIALRLIRGQLAGWHKGTIAQQRARQERSARFFKVPGNVTCQAVMVDEILAEWVECIKADDTTILYLHGGAYALGSLNTHRELVARLVTAAKCRALVIDYRLAPEHPFPDALEDSLKAYRWLISQGHNPSRIFLAGDSAGGGLAICALLYLRDHQGVLPAGAICLSPWLDLKPNADTTAGHGEKDPILKRSILSVYAGYYCQNHKPDEPYISPIYADLHGLPPIQIQCGENEVLLEDAVNFSEKAGAAGVQVSLQTWADMFHVFQLIPLLPQSTEALQQAAHFIEQIKAANQKRSDI